MGLKLLVMKLLDMNLDVEDAGNLVVEGDVVVPIGELDLAADEAAAVELVVVEVTIFRVKLYFGPSSFAATSRMLRRRSAISSRSSCISRSQLLSLAS